MSVRSMKIASLALTFGFLLSSCSGLDFYRQAILGHLDLLDRRVPVQRMIADQQTPLELRVRLETLQKVRDFAVSKLALPDNASYRSYADLRRPYVVWNVFAAPELSLEPERWCYPVVGCLSYRGYYARADADRLAAELERRGLDVWVAGVPAYSSLGWFDDPLLNTFVHWPEGRVVELVFHELAHQKIHVANDTTFNESFATAVAMLGADLWLDSCGTAQARREFQRTRERREEFLALMLRYRVALEHVYESPLPDPEKRLRKRALQDGLAAEYRAWRNENGGYDGYDRVVALGPNNAWFSALSAYQSFVPAFGAVFESANRDFERFYAMVEDIARLEKIERHRCLRALSEGHSTRSLSSLGKGSYFAAKAQELRPAERLNAVYRRRCARP